MVTVVARSVLGAREQSGYPWARGSERSHEGDAGSTSFVGGGVSIERRPRFYPDLQAPPSDCAMVHSLVDLPARLCTCLLSCVSPRNENGVPLDLLGWSASRFPASDRGRPGGGRPCNEARRRVGRGFKIRNPSVRSSGSAGRCCAGHNDDARNANPSHFAWCTRESFHNHPDLCTVCGDRARLPPL